MAHNSACPEHCPQAHGTGVSRHVLMLPWTFIGACLAFAIVVQVARDVWPYVACAVFGLVALKAGAVLYRWRHRRRVAARMLPMPDPALMDAPARTMVSGGFVRSLDGTVRALPGMTKTPAPVKGRAR